MLHDILTETNTPFVVPNKTCGRNADCFNDVNRFSCIRGLCVEKTRTFYWDAVIPKDPSDPTLPLFAESEWMDVGMRLFEEDSPATQLTGFLAGMVLTIGSAAVCFWMRRNAVV